MTHETDEHTPHPVFGRSRYAVGLVTIGGVAPFFLLTQYCAHFLGALPYLLLLTCPLMHLQWPTLLTLLMFPVLLIMYGRLAVTEEAEMRAEFDAEFDRYAVLTPRFIPGFTQSISAK